MSAIESLQSFGSQKAEAGSHSAAPELGKDDFLNLLVTQLKNQDPLNPSDPTEFTAQLAQYSSLEQLFNINESMQSLDSLSGEFGRLSALSLIDRNVVVNDNTFQFDGEQSRVGFSFQDSVESATVYIQGQNGQSVRQIEAGNPLQGQENWIEWDGTDSNGQLLEPGSYTFSVIGQTLQGIEVHGQPLVESRIIGADFSDSDQTLITDNGSIQVSEITRVSR